MLRVLRFIILSMVLVAPISQAGDIPGSCLVSFNVKNASFTTGTTTMSCVLLETRRAALFQQINALPGSGVVDGAELAKRLAEVEATLKKAEGDVNWTALSIGLTGNVVATIGLSACVETAGGGCAMAIISKVLSLAGIIDSAVSDSAKISETAAVRSELASIRQKIASISAPADDLRAQLVKDFTEMCSDVKAYCMAP